MSDRPRDSVDQFLAQSFSSASLADGGFSEAVLRRIRRRQRVRRILVGSAAVVGSLVALVPAWDLIAAAGLDLGSVVTQWSAVGAVPAYVQAAPAGIVAMMTLLLARALEG